MHENSKHKISLKLVLQILVVTKLTRMCQIFEYLFNLTLITMMALMTCSLSFPEAKFSHLLLSSVLA